LILGEKEMQSGNISVRQHKIGDKGSISVNDFVNSLNEEIKNRLNNN